MTHPPSPPKRSHKRRAVPYFQEPTREGTVAVYREPCGNRVAPKLCGVMPNRASAAALINQLVRAEDAVHDLFLEATDDGIEALEAVLRACREWVLAHPAAPVRGGAARPAAPRGTPSPKARRRRRRQ